MSTTSDGGDGRHAMFIHAHPDDESSKGAATMARYAKEGARVSVVTLTDGSAGEILNPRLQDRQDILEDLVAVRQEELALALHLLGVSDHFDLGYRDSGWVKDFDRDGSVLADEAFYNVPVAEVAERLVPIIRRTRPQVLVTYDEDGGYPHPDHIRTHDVTIAAWRAAADPTVLPEAGPPWRASKIYYQLTFTKRRLETLVTECDRRGIETPLKEWLARWDGAPPERITTRIQVADHIATRTAALRAHRTQVDPDGMWFSIPDEVIAEVYPFEEFRLAYSEVATDRPEEDLFAGLDV